jgi:hypothetical protein
MGEPKDYNNCLGWMVNRCISCKGEKSLPGGFYPLRYVSWTLEIFFATATLVLTCLLLGRQKVIEWMLRSTVHKRSVFAILHNKIQI